MMRFKYSLFLDGLTSALLLVFSSFFFSLIVIGCFLSIGGCCSSLSKLERLERPVVVVAKSNVDDSRSIVVKDKNGRLLKLTETAFVYTYNPGDTLK